MPKSYDVLFASGNKNKYEEAEKILAEFGIKLKFFKTNLLEIQSYGWLDEIAEQKALDAYSKCKEPVIVEDSGLFIKDLRGFPGPFSSYAFQTLGNIGILGLLNSVRHTYPPSANPNPELDTMIPSNYHPNRHASFVAVTAFCDSNQLSNTGYGNPILFEASVRGKISESVRPGKRHGDGWGYDPIFIPEEQNPAQKTYAELISEELDRWDKREAAEEIAQIESVTERQKALEAWVDKLTLTKSTKHKLSHRYKSLKQFASWFNAGAPHAPSVDSRFKNKQG